jgi:hypothetical protein
MGTRGAMQSDLYCTHSGGADYLFKYALNSRCGLQPCGCVASVYVMRCEVSVGDIAGCEDSSDGGTRRMYSGIWFPNSGSDLTNGRVTTLRKIEGQ